MRFFRQAALPDQLGGYLQDKQSQVNASDTPVIEAARTWQNKTRARAHELRNLLGQPTHGHCHFCDVNEGTDVEHFLPKGLHPQLCFVYENLNISCSGCNTHKGGGSVNDTAANTILCPGRDDPRTRLVFVPYTGFIVGLDAAAELTINRLNLNRQFLAARRVLAWRNYQRLIRRYTNELTSGALDRIEMTAHEIHSSSSHLIYWFIVGQTAVYSDDLDEETIEAISIATSLPRPFA